MLFYVHCQELGRLSTVTSSVRPWRVFGRNASDPGLSAEPSFQFSRKLPGSLRPEYKGGGARANNDQQGTQGIQETLPDGGQK